jgi:hypothetical protein
MWLRGLLISSSVLGPRGPGLSRRPAASPKSPEPPRASSLLPWEPRVPTEWGSGLPRSELEARRGTKQTANNSWTAGITCAYAIRGATGPNFHPTERQLWVHSRRVVLGGARWQLGQQVWWLYQQTDTRASFVSFSLLQKALFEEAPVGGA